MMFAAVTPGLPLFLYLNNILELRLDAKKLLHYFERPVPKRVNDIGIWDDIMEIVFNISIVTNV